MISTDINNIPEIKVSYNPLGNDKPLKLSAPYDAYEAFLSVWDTGTINLFEEMKLMLLKRNNKVVGIYPLSKGNYHSTLLNVPLLFGIVLKSGLENFIIAHNHPSGNLKPSSGDNSYTKRILALSHFHGLNFIDNMIITEDGYFSYREETGIFKNEKITGFCHDSLKRL